MECSDARLLLETARPLAKELPPRDLEALANHLADCPDCGPWAETERQADEQISLAMQSVRVTPELSQRLMRRLDAERDAWYRVRVVRVAGIAAVLLLTVWTGWAIWGSARQSLSLDEVLENSDQLLPSQDDVEVAFYEDGIAMTAPPDFDYNFFHSCGVAVLKGREVPYLLFARSQGNRPPAIALVYVLSDRQFNLVQSDSLTRTGSRKNVTVLKYPNHPHLLFLVIYSGVHSADDFRINIKASP